MVSSGGEWYKSLAVHGIIGKVGVIMDGVTHGMMGEVDCIMENKIGSCVVQWMVYWGKWVA